MNIVMTSSDLYSRLAITTFKSLFIHNRDINEIVIYYIGDQLTDESRNNLTRLVNEHDAPGRSRRIIFIPMPDGFERLTGSKRNGQTVFCYCYFQESGGQSPSDSFGGPGRGSGFSVLPCFRARCFNDLNCKIVQTDTIFVLEN